MLQYQGCGTQQFGLRLLRNFPPVQCRHRRAQDQYRPKHSGESRALSDRPRVIQTVDVGQQIGSSRSLLAQQQLHQRIDAAVLASGIQQRIEVEAMTDADWQRHMDVNLTGIFYVVRALFPVMKHQRSGALVVFTSGLATQGWPGATAYGASKAGLIALVKSAAQELKAHGVRINAVSPGIMNTPLFQDSASAEEVAMYQRTLGVSEPEEVTPMLMHLISDGAATISGNVLERRLIPHTQNESPELLK